MAKRERIIIILLLALTVLFFCSVIILSIIAWQQRARRIEMAGLLQQTKQEKKFVEERLDKVISLRLELELKLKEAEVKIADLVTKLKELEAAKIDLSSQLGTKERVISRLSTNFESEKREKAELANKLMNLEEECKGFKARIEQLEAVKVDLEKKLEEAASKVQLEKIVVKPAEGDFLPQGENPSSIEGRILVINREFDFLVTDLGQEDGIELGNTFLVYTDGESLGRLQVEKLYKDMSITTFLPGARKEEIKEGDSVRMLVSP